MPRGPSEAEETAVSADGTEVAFFSPSVNCSGDCGGVEREKEKTTKRSCKRG